MANFNYETHPVVGRLSINDMSGYGKIKVYGYLDGGTFRRLPTSEAKSIFSPDGTVFASKTIKRDYYGLNNSIVFLYAMLNSNEGGSNKYVWNFDYEVEPIGVRIVELKEPLSDNGGLNYEVLSSKGLLGKGTDVFVHSNDRLLFIKGDSDTRLIPYFTYDDSLPIVGGYPDGFIIGNSFPDIKGYIDVTSDEQLVDWFLRVAKTNISDIQTGTGKVALNAARESLLSMKNLPENIALSRIKRLQTIIGSFVISRENLNSLAKSPWFKPTIDSAVDRYKDDFLGDVKKEYQQYLEELTEAHKIAVEEEIEKHDRKIQSIQESTEKLEAQSKAKIKELNEQVAGAKTSLERLDVEIEKKQTELSSIQKSLDGILERKDDIIRDFNVVRDVLGLSEMKDVSATSSVNVQKLQSINFSDKRLPFYKGFENNIENCLSLSQTKIESISELARMHACYNVILLPNADMAMSIVAAAGKAFYRIAYVSVAWKSFNDVWANGLHRIVTHCFEMPDTIHYFVLRNINLSCLSNYLQPLADMQAGVLDSFPETDILFPDNLRVLLTVSDEELIPMSEGVLRYFGCVSRDIETGEHWRIDYSTAQCIGYLDTKLLSKAAEEVEEPNNYYQEYVDE